MVQRRKTDRDDHIGRKLYEARCMAGMSQTDLGEKIGVTFQQVQKYEKGDNRISAGRLSDAAACLNQPITFFYDGISGPATEPDKVTRRVLHAAAALNRVVNDDTRNSIIDLIHSCAEKED